MTRKEDNVKAVRISHEILAEMMTTGWRGAVECVFGLPRGAEFVGAEIEPVTGDAQYIFRHPDFPGVAWDQMPLQEVIFKRLP